MSFGQIPVLEVDGKILSQSMAINRYLARQFHLTGKDDWEAAQCDALADGWTDLTSHMRGLQREKDEEKKQELTDQFIADHLEPFLVRYHHFLSSNGGKFFVGSGITWVDLLFANVFRNWVDKFPDAMGGHHKLIEFAERIEAIPNVEKWIENRPDTLN